MRIKPFVILFLLLTSFASQAQTPKSFVLGVTTGFSLPLGSFGFNNSVIGVDQMPGFATLGLELGLQGTYTFSPYWGATGRLNLNGFEGNLNNFLATSPNGDRMESSRFGYGAVTALAGPQYRIRLLASGEFYASALFGINAMGTNGYEQRSSAGPAATYRTELRYPVGMAYGGNVGYQSLSIRKVRWLVEAELLSLGYRQVEVNLSQSYNGKQSNYSYKADQTIHWLTVKAGVVFAL